MTDYETELSIQGRSKQPKTGFCLECGLELTKDDPNPYCLGCDHVYQEWMEEVSNEE